MKQRKNNDNLELVGAVFYIKIIQLKVLNLSFKTLTTVACLHDPKDLSLSINFTGVFLT